MGPENRTVVSNDNFLRVNLIGDLVGYTNIPSFEDFYLVIPRQVYAYSTIKPTCLDITLLEFTCLFLSSVSKLKTFNCDGRVVLVNHRI